MNIGICALLTRLRTEIALENSNTSASCTRNSQGVHKMKLYRTQKTFILVIYIATTFFTLQDCDYSVHILRHFHLNMIYMHRVYISVLLYSSISFEIRYYF